MGSNNSTHIQAIDSENINSGKGFKRDSSTVNSLKSEAKHDRVHSLSAGKKRSAVIVDDTEVQELPQQADPADTDVITSRQLSNIENQLEREHTQLEEVERQNLELQDYIENLESQLEAIDREHESKGQSEDFSETLKLKEHDIHKLQKENEALKVEMTKLRAKCKKKVRILNTKLTEKKNEGSVQALEMREEMKTLQEENGKLQEQQQSGGTEPGFDESRKESNDQSHTHIIVELSSRVSEQDARITQLENTLHDKNKEIERLQKSQNGNKPNEPTDSDKRSSFASKGENTENTNLNIDTGTDWYGNKTFEDISRHSASNTLTPNASSRSYPGRDVNRGDDTDSTKSELQAIAEEMKQLRKRKPKSKRTTAVARLSEHRSANNEGELSGRDAGLSADLQNHSPISASAPHLGAYRTGSGVSNTSSVLSNDSLGRAKIPAKNILGVTSLRDRPSSGGVRYDADISQCDTDLGLSENSNNELEYEESECSTTGPRDRSNIRQISAPRTKKRSKGLLKSLVRKNSLGPDNLIVDSSGPTGVSQKPPVYKVKSRDPEVQDADMLINSIDEDLLLHNKSSSNSFSLTAVS